VWLWQGGDDAAVVDPRDKASTKKDPHEQEKNRQLQVGVCCRIHRAGECPEVAHLDQGHSNENGLGKAKALRHPVITPT
jgi:hypothetical protein